MTWCGREGNRGRLIATGDLDMRRLDARRRPWTRLVPVLVGMVIVVAPGTPLRALAGGGPDPSTQGGPQHACPAADQGYARCHAIVSSMAHGRATNTNPNAGYTPAQLQSAYALASASAANGSGETVAIVDAYDDPKAISDLDTYRRTFGLGGCTVSPPAASGCTLTNGATVRKVSQTGTQTYPRGNHGWGQEISLDLDMVSAICPHCNILLVEATTNSIANLGIAENEAATLGANAISNSYGASEFSGETADDGNYDHPGVAVTASTGDSGYGVEWPAASPSVTAAGGTSLTAASNARGWTETAWSGAGSGCSAYESRPSWQAIAAITAVCARRATADVSAVADPNTGVSVYDTYAGLLGQSGWLVFGGTSVASPIIASVYALAGNTSTAPGAPYANTTALNDVTSGSNAGLIGCGNALCTAGAGWDGPTGLGTPKGIGAF
jgi:subtilase family serine protease